MEKIGLDIKNIYGTVSEATVTALYKEAEDALAHVLKGDAPGNDFLGWVDLPSRTDKALIDDINLCAQAMRDTCDGW